MLRRGVRGFEINHDVCQNSNKKQTHRRFSDYYFRALNFGKSRE